jgi:hypothetical protein
MRKKIYSVLLMFDELDGYVKAYVALMIVLFLIVLFRR